jgi:hypothetical protein
MVRGEWGCDPCDRSIAENGATCPVLSPGDGQMKPEQLKIEQLRREFAKLKAERDVPKGLRLGGR